MYDHCLKIDELCGPGYEGRDKHFTEAQSRIDERAADCILCAPRGAIQENHEVAEGHQARGRNAL